MMMTPIRLTNLQQAAQRREAATPNQPAPVTARTGAGCGRP
jgi:hypothetical protein